MCCRFFFNTIRKKKYFPPLRKSVVVVGAEHARFTTKVQSFPFQNGRRFSSVRRTPPPPPTHINCALCRRRRLCVVEQFESFHLFESEILTALLPATNKALFEIMLLVESLWFFFLFKLVRMSTISLDGSATVHIQSARARVLSLSQRHGVIFFQ